MWRLSQAVLFCPFQSAKLHSSKSKLSAGDIYLASAEILGINAVIHGRNNFFWLFISAEHVGVGHAGMGRVAKLSRRQLPRRFRPISEALSSSRIYNL